MLDASISATLWKFLILILNNLFKNLEEKLCNNFGYQIALCIQPFSKILMIKL